MWFIIITTGIISAFFGIVVAVGLAEKHGYRKGYADARDKRRPIWEPYD